MSEASAKKSLAKAKGMELMTDQKRGTIKFIHGDSRYLPEALCGVDTIATSPPFFSTIQERGHQGKGEKNIAADPEKHGHKGIVTLYAENEDNIDNLRCYGWSTDGLWIDADYDMNQLIIGTLLGDGYLVPNKNSPYLRLVHSIKQKDYILWKYFILKPIIKADIWEQTSGYGSDMLAFRTTSQLIFKELKKLLYIDGKKIITREYLDLLDDFGLAVWFMDDGSLAGCSIDKRNNKDRKGYLRIATNSFTKDEHKIIIQWFIDKYDIHPRIGKLRDKYYEITFPIEETKKLIKIIYPYIIPSMRYKLKVKYLNEIDSIIMSPVYGGIRNEGGQYQKKHIEEKMKLFRNYNDDDPTLSDPNQIGNLAHGDIDLVVKSPPYGHESYTAKDQKKTKWREEHGFEIGHEKSDWYGEDTGNIGLLKHEPDVIVQSPPFSPQRTGGSQGAGTYSGTDLSKGKNRVKDDYETVSDDNIGQKKGMTYISEMLKVYRGCYQVLKNDGYMVLVTKNFVKAGKEVRLDLDTIKLCELAGFKHVDTWWHKLNTESFWQILLRKRCSNIKFTKKEKLIEQGKDKIIYACNKSGVYDLKCHSDDALIPMCKKHYCARCPYDLTDQKKCEEYENIYPKIEHEHILCFVKR